MLVSINIISGHGLCRAHSIYERPYKFRDIFPRDARDNFILRLRLQNIRPFLLFMFIEDFNVKFWKMLMLYQIIYSLTFMSDRRIVVRVPTEARYVSRSIPSPERQAASGVHPAYRSVQLTNHLI
jgi:hypothetical protein